MLVKLMKEARLHELPSSGGLKSDPLLCPVGLGSSLCQNIYVPKSQADMSSYKGTCTPRAVTEAVEQMAWVWAC